MSSAPKAFISHASENKADYAKPLADALLKLGIDAWLDKYEIKPGDDLIKKIFDEGMGNASTVVFIMTPISLVKPWVRHELSNAVTRHINGELRLIPVVAEDCDVPQSIMSLLWIHWENEGGVNGVANKIAQTMFELSERPCLGGSPAYAQVQGIQISGLTNIDSLVIEALYEAALKDLPTLLQWYQIEEFATRHGIDYETAEDSVQVLSEKGYLINQDLSSFMVNVPSNVMLDIAMTKGIPVEHLLTKVAGYILNDKNENLISIAEELNIPRGLACAIGEYFRDHGFVQMSYSSGPSAYVYLPSAGFKRWLQER